MNVDALQYPVKVLDIAIPMLKQRLCMFNNISNITKEIVYNNTQDGSIATAYVEKQPYYEVKEGWGDDHQGVKIEKAAISINKKKNVGISLEAEDITLNAEARKTAFEKYVYRCVEPSVTALGNQLENDLSSLWKEVANYCGTPASLPTTFVHFGTPIMELKKIGVDASKIKLLLGSEEALNLGSYFAGLMNPSMVENAVKRAGSDIRGYIGEVGGAMAFENFFRPIHTSGTQNGSYATNGASQGGDGNLVVKTGTGTLVQGDVITVTSCNAWNKSTGATVGSVRKHVVKTAYTPGGAGTVVLRDKLVESGAYKNVDSLIADSKAITAIAASTTYKVNMAFAPEAFACAIVPIKETPNGVKTNQMVTRQYENIYLTMVTEFDGNGVLDKNKLLICYGYAAIDTDRAIRFHA